MDKARELWRLLEPIHAVVYFAPDARQRFDAVGLRGFWMGYFASRSAALGPVGPEMVTAAFYVFDPAMVARALPDAWAMSTPERVLQARAELADNALRGALGELASSEEVAAAAGMVVPIAQAAPLAGRVLAAAHAALPVPPSDQPLARLWWAATVLREHRGDGHVASLLTAGIGPCEALVLAAATGGYGPEGAKLLQASRQWSDDDWSSAAERLARRGWLTADGALTDAGRQAYQSVEDSTDRLAASAYAPFPDHEIDRLSAVLRSFADRIGASGAVPTPNPVGVPIEAAT